MSETAHKINHTFHVTFNVPGFATGAWYPLLESDNPTSAIKTEAGQDIELDGQSITTIALPAYKVKSNVFIAVGGAT